MHAHPREIARTMLRREWEHLTAVERHVLEHVQARTPIARNTNQEFGDARTLGQRMSDRVAAFGGSWRFVIGFVVVLVGWVALNSWVLARAREAFDPYPYILLNLVLSMIAAIQAPIIMMSQNRQAAKDRLDAAHDFEVNLKAELEIRSLHEEAGRAARAQLGGAVQPAAGAGPHAGTAAGGAHDAGTAAAGLIRPREQAGRRDRRRKVRASSPRVQRTFTCRI